MARHAVGIVRLTRDLVQADVEAGRLARLLPEYECVYPSGEKPGVYVLYPNRRVLHRTRLLIDFLKQNL